MAKTPADKLQAIRQRAEEDLIAFINLVHPQRVLGQVHIELCKWWQREDAKTHQLVLLPRDHQKSALMAYRVAQAITKNPAIRILYISSTSNLATKQLKFIKDILTSPGYRRYWPEMINANESAREKWTTEEISVDHPLRKQEVIRDPTVFTAGLTTAITGLHCDIAVLDDVVVDDTAYTPEGRVKVRDQISYLASILGTEGQLWAVGTRYHPLDAYQDMATTEYDLFDADGNIICTEKLYEVFEKKVEDRGDGTGTFIWPRMQRSDGKWFGFNRDILSKKKAQYSDLTKFRSQYYNDPNDIEGSSIKHSMFQYFDKGLLTQANGYWYFKDRRLNVAAAMDFAHSLKREADYTTIAVVGVDSQNNYYVLDLERFKTNQISDYFHRLLRSHTRWGYRKVRMETTAAQSTIVESLKKDWIVPHGLALAVEPISPRRDKHERTEGILQPKYANQQVWHFHGGNCQILEEELTLQHPPHDDLRDSVANAVDMLVAPSRSSHALSKQRTKVTPGGRFGGIS